MSKKNEMTLSKEDLILRLRKTENVIMNAIRCGDWERGEAATVLQAIGYVLLDEELYPDEDDVWPPDEEDIPEELQFKFDEGYDEDEGPWNDEDEDDEVAK